MATDKRHWFGQRTERFSRRVSPDGMGHDLGLNEARSYVETAWQDQRTKTALESVTDVMVGCVFKKRNGRYSFMIMSQHGIEKYAKQFRLILEWTYDGSLWTAAGQDGAR